MWRKLWIAVTIFIQVQSLYCQQVTSKHTTATSESDYFISCGVNTKYRACFDILHYDLNVRYNIKNKSIAGSNTITFRTLTSSDTLQLDLHANMLLDSIVFQQKKVLPVRIGNIFYVLFSHKLEALKISKLKIYYHGKPVEATNPPWEGGIVWKTDKLNNPWVGVACEGLGASSWWPCKDYLADKPDSVRCVYEVPLGLECVGNGIFVQKKKVNKKYNSFEWKTSYPIANYNITFNIGKYAQFQEVHRYDKDSLLMDYYVMPYNLTKAKKHFTQTDTILQVFEHYFGKYPFPKDGYALIETSYAGMEHQGAISYGNNFKTNYLVDFIILHETAHEWWGNNVAVDDLAEMWIQESFATYSEWLYYEKLYGTATAQGYADHQRTMIKNEKPMLGNRGVCFPSLDNLDIYYKGAWMIHTLRSWTNNDSLWFATIKGLQTNFGKQPVNTAMLLPYLKQQLKILLEEVVNYYLTSTKLPVLEYELLPLASDSCTLRYQWRVEKGFKFDMPVLVFINNKKILLNATTTAQSLFISDTEAKNILFPKEKYLAVFEKMK